MKREKILTISMLCNGKTESVFKTLNSIAPILQNVDSELIIVDTGCTDEYLSRFREYTDNVIKFAWINDFAAARNAGLSAANGQWFMFIDDDEWFEDTTPIIDFFLSGEYKKYNYATYKKRNYWDFAMTGYEDVPAVRLFEIKDGYKFVSKIHEYYNAPEVNKKYIDCYVHHFGYCYKNEDERIQKSLRNIIPLREMIADNPNNMHARYQLIQELFIAKKYLALLDECNVSLEISNKNRDVAASSVCAFYLGCFLATSSMGRWDDAYQQYSRALEYKDLTGVAKARLYVLAIPVLEKLNKYDELKRIIEAYDKIYNKYCNNNELILREQCVFSNNPFDHVARNFVNEHKLITAIKYNDTIEYQKAFEEINWDSVYSDAMAQSMINELVKVLGSESLSDSQYHMVDEIIVKLDYVEHTKDGLIAALKREKNNSLLIDNVLNVKADNYYIDYIQALHSLNTNQIEHTQRYLISAVDHGMNIFECDDNLIDCFQEGSLDLNSIVKRIGRGIFIKQLKQAVDDKKPNILGLIECLSGCFAEDDIRYSCILKYMIEYQLITINPSEFNGYQDMRDTFEFWCELTLKYYSMLYKPDAFINCLEMLPEDCAAAVYINGFIQSADRDVVLALNNLKKAIETYPQIKECGQNLMKLYMER